MNEVILELFAMSLVISGLFTMFLLCFPRNNENYKEVKISLLVLFYLVVFLAYYYYVWR